MNKTSLSSLYQRMTASAGHDVDAADLAALADGSLAPADRERVARAVAASQAEAGVMRMLRDLRADSEALAADLGAQRIAHRTRRAAPAQRVGTERRRTGIARWAAVAACLVAIVGAWTLRDSIAPSNLPSRHQTATVARADHIFSSSDTIFDGAMEQGSSARGDHLFKGSFNGG